MRSKIHACQPETVFDEMSLNNNRYTILMYYGDKA